MAIAIYFLCCCSWGSPSSALFRGGGGGGEPAVKNMRRQNHASNSTVKKNNTKNKPACRRNDRSPNSRVRLSLNSKPYLNKARTTTDRLLPVPKKKKEKGVGDGLLGCW